MTETPTSGAMPPPTSGGDISAVAIWLNHHFNVQMASWLDFALMNRFHPRYLKCQTQRTVHSMGAPYSGRAKAHRNRGSPPGRYPAQRWTPINNYLLYKDWRAFYLATFDWGLNWDGQPVRQQARRIYLRYDEAAPEMHAYFDFIADQTG